MKISQLALSCFFAVSLFAEKKDLHSALEPVPRQGGWMKRHESFNKRVAQGKVDLVLIGDSITQGWEGRGKKVWKTHYGKRNAVNLGIGGDRTQHVIWRLDNGNLKGIAPKAAVVMIGTNNAGTTANETAQDTGITPSHFPTGRQQGRWSTQGKREGQCHFQETGRRETSSLSRHRTKVS